MKQVWFILLTGLLIIGSRVSAQGQIAVSIQVTASGVSLQRGDASNWVVLSLDAQAAISAGDRLRTNETGRVFITLADGTETLLLPGATYTLIQIGQDGAGRLTLEAQVEGRSIHTSAPDQFASYRLHVGDLIVTTPASAFAVQTRADDRDYLVVSQGDAAVQLAFDATMTVTTGEGLRLSPGLIEQFESMIAPQSFAQVDGALDGCVGRVDTRVPGDLNVRTQVTVRADEMGVMVNGASVYVMGVRQTGFGPWYRIQFRADFGWVTGDSIELDCPDLPDLDLLTPEDPLGIIRALPQEVELLRPYYGDPADDIWFYRSLRSG